jgi:hypothetical protein
MIKTKPDRRLTRRAGLPAFWRRPLVTVAQDQQAASLAGQKADDQQGTYDRNPCCRDSDGDSRYDNIHVCGFL